MSLDHSILFLLFIGMIILVGFFIVKQFHVSPLKRFELIVTYFGGISVLLMSYNIYITIQSNNLVEKNRIAYNTISNIQKNYLGPQEELVHDFPEGFFLYASMNPDIDFSKLTPEHWDAAKRKQIEIYGSLRVFQAMEDFLSTARYDITGMYVWINNFLMWMQSPILREYWKTLGFNYSVDTRELVQRIVQKADELIALRNIKGKLSAEDYDAVSKAFPITCR